MSCGGAGHEAHCRHEAGTRRPRCSQPPHHVQLRRQAVQRVAVCRRVLARVHRPSSTTSAAALGGSRDRSAARRPTDSVGRRVGVRRRHLGAVHPALPAATGRPIRRRGTRDARVAGQWRRCWQVSASVSVELPRASLGHRATMHGA